MDPLRVMVVDDHPLFRFGLCTVLADVPGTEVVGEAATGLDSIDAAKALRPDAQDFLVIAFGMGGTYRSGLQLGLRTDAVELSPTVPSRMPVYFPDADRFLDHPKGRVIVSDGRNYVRLSRETYDMVAVDPALVGGLVLEVGSRRLDASVRGRLERLHRQLTTTRSVS